ncbi:hypothetical protein PPYR_10559 [Photinus pyralis]|uniref:Corticotropin-releasing factor domain-containing protein n=1 Tax=Photinus pyralis TaxID=7054 RepID=A0A1Y1LBK0_PHOPY|nr:uncharacterized protein LOC116173988 [Photinus pyralis]XP_031347612.1 uncharacterized protein LOC116173988 [Photinus pyralis]KAB0796498.1 hypothetical protein PPYR_10559 [Photinus pyralis]
MRVPVYFVCAALILYVKSEDRTNYDRRIEPLDLTADQETVSYLLPKLTAKYRPNTEWNGVKDPRFYVLTEAESNDIDFQEPLIGEGRIKRQGLNGGPSLSIVNSLDVLRNRLLLEIARKKQLEGMNRNRNLLSSVGKRAILGHRGLVPTFDNF